MSNTVFEDTIGSVFKVAVHFYNALFCVVGVTLFIFGLPFQKKFDLPLISIHDLRHSHASLLVYLVENPIMMQERLGHADIEMILGTYSRLYPNEDVEVVKRLDYLG